MLRPEYRHSWHWLRCNRCNVTAHVDAFPVEASTKPELAEISSEAVLRPGLVARVAAAAVANSSDGVRRPGFAKHSATTEAGVGVPKISCPGKVEVVKKFPSGA